MSETIRAISIFVATPSVLTVAYLSANLGPQIQFLGLMCIGISAIAFIAWRIWATFAFWLGLLALCAPLLLVFAFTEFYVWASGATTIWWMSLGSLGLVTLCFVAIFAINRHRKINEE